MHIPTVDRRRFLWSLGGGLGGVALAHLLSRDGLLAAERPYHVAKAKRVVQLFMSGAASQVDTFDYKPELVKRDGKPFDPGGKVELFQSSPGACMQSPWKWNQHGQCGKYVSSLVPHLASCVDDIAFIHSMVTKSNVHGPATFMQNTGFVMPGFPSMGAWIGYGLGSMNDNLPAFVVLPDTRGFAPNGPANWSNGFLPATHQGTMVRSGAKNPIFALFPGENAYITKESDAEGQQLLEQLNREHLSTREGDSRLNARIASYELPRDYSFSARRCSTFPANRKQLDACMVWIKRPPRTLAAIASWPGGCWSAVFAVSRCGAAPTTAFRAAIGTRTKTLPAITATWPPAWIVPRPPC